MTTIDRGNGTGSANEVQDEEYRELWAYVRHVENLRHTMVGGLVALATAVLALLSDDLGKSREFQTLTNVFVLCFLAVLFVLALVFLASHKRNYDVYLSYIRPQSEAARHVRRQERRVAPFQAYYAIVTSLVAGVGLLLAYAIPWSGWAFATPPVALVVISIVIYWYWVCVPRKEATPSA